MGNIYFDSFLINIPGNLIDVANNHVGLIDSYPIN